MKTRHAMLAASLVIALGMASPSHATNTNGHDSSSSTPSSGSATSAQHVYADSTDTGTSSGSLSPRHRTSSDTSSSGDCDNTASTNNLGNCGGHDDDSTGGSSRSSLGWQSLLPGSIQ